MTAGHMELTTPVKQNWIISARADVLLIIAAPILWFLWAAVFQRAFSPEIVVSIFLGFNIGHHLPTFIRIYGDKDLLKRFRYSLLLGPILPFSAAMCVSGYFILSNLPLYSALFLLMILTIWDPWHFLMQHFGFMRIYDRHNKAPRKLAGRMDLAISATWFVHILIATATWLPSNLYLLYNFHALPFARLFTGGVYALVEQVSLALAVGMTIVYIGYLFWCRWNNYYISPAKLMILVITFGMTYFTYVPNALMEKLIPDWTFGLGFAALGMVHVTQYLAIVWKYNRGLASREGSAREGRFRKFFSRGGFLLGVLYLIVCLFYGYSLQHTKYLVNSEFAQSFLSIAQSQWILAILLSANFTSTLMHYYYDGFIWKIRHKENQKNLAIEKSNETESTSENSSGKSSQEKSWWDASRPQEALAVFFRQACYFLIPISILTVTYISHNKDSQARPGGYMPLKLLNNIETPQQTRDALEAMRRQAELEELMIQIRPQAHHYLYLAELTYEKAVLEHRFKHPILGSDEDQDRKFEEQIAKAIQLMETGLKLPGPHWNQEHVGWERAEFEELLSKWKSSSI